MCWPDRRLSRKHPELARVVAGPEAPEAGAAPKLAVGDGAMGFWAALHEASGKTRVQRC
jgi:hypothetical protein